jgi:hypothetical protein
MIVYECEECWMSGRKEFRMNQKRSEDNKLRSEGMMKELS